mgnify:CR=1 FL=1
MRRKGALLLLLLRRELFEAAAVRGDGIEFFAQSLRVLGKTLGRQVIEVTMADLHRLLADGSIQEARMDLLAVRYQTLL